MHCKISCTSITGIMNINFPFKVLSLPFILTNENVGDISKSADTWIGTFDISFAGQWWDLFVAMVKLNTKSILHIVL